jgi:hypothetical protein
MAAKRSKKVCRQAKRRASASTQMQSTLQRAAFYRNRSPSLLRRFTISLIWPPTGRRCRIGDKSFDSIRLAGSQEEGVGRASARTTPTETVECDPSFRMAERVSPLRPLSMMAFHATAEGGDRFCGRH